MTSEVVSSAGLDRSKAARLIKEKGLEGMLFTSPENVFYTTGAHTLPGTGNPILFALRGSLPTISYIDSSGMVTLFIWMGSTMGIEYKDQDVRTFIDRAGAEEELVSFLKERVHEGSRIGIESSCPWWALVKAEEALGTEGVVPADEIPLALRIVKSPGEIDLLERATEIVEEGVADLKSSLRAGLSRMELGQLARLRLTERGATAVDHLTIAFGSANPEVLLDQALNEGQLVTLDLGAVYQGYVSDNRRLFFLGSTVPEATRKLHATLVGIVDAVGAALKPGVTFSEIFALAVSLYEGEGLQPMFFHVGHSIGIQTEEAWITGESSLKVQEKMVLNIELYAPDESGQMIGDEETYVIESDGSRRLTVSSREIAAISPPSG